MITAVGDALRRCYERGWITTRDGNCSLRRANSIDMHVTPSGWRKTIIHPEHMVKIKFVDGALQVPQGSMPPGIYRGFDLQNFCQDFPEIYRYTRIGPTVPPLPAISKELGEATAQASGVTSVNPAGDYDIVGQANHGICAMASDPWGSSV